LLASQNDQLEAQRIVWGQLGLYFNCELAAGELGICLDFEVVRVELNFVAVFTLGWFG
jgi:hypothetical protein